MFDTFNDTIYPFKLKIPTFQVQRNLQSGFPGKQLCGRRFPLLLPFCAVGNIRCGDYSPIYITHSCPCGLHF